MNKKEKLIAGCDNEHDRQLMIEHLKEFGDSMFKARLAMAVGVVFCFGAIILLKLSQTELMAGISLISFLCGFCCLVYSATAPLRNVGLI